MKPCPRTAAALRVLCGFAVIVGCCSPLAAQPASQQSKRIETLIRDLGAKDFTTRERAQRELIETGPDVLDQVAKTLASTDDPEVRLRCRAVLVGMKLKPRRIAELGPSRTEFPGLGDVRSADGSARLWRGRTPDGWTSLIRNGKIIAKEPQIGVVSVSGDGRHYAYTVRFIRSVLVEGKEEDTVVSYVVHDGVKGPEFYEVGWPYLSREGRLVYTATKPFLKTHRHVLMLDGVVKSDRYNRTWMLRPWTDDGHLVFTVGTGKVNRVMIDDIEGPPHQQVWLSKEGRSNRYVVLDHGQLWSVEASWPDPKPGEKARIEEKKVALLGKVPPDLKEWGNVYVTADAEHIWFNFMAPKGPAYHNGTRIDGITDWIVAPDGFHVSAVVERKDGRHLLVDGVEGPVYDKNLLIHSCGPCWVYQANRDGKVFVMHRGGRLGPFDRVEDMTVSADGKHFAVLALEAERKRLFVDGAPRAVHPDAVNVVLSPDGRHVLLKARRKDRDFIVIDGREGPGYARIKTIRFSPDGKHVRHDASRLRTQFMVCDGIEGPEHERIGLTMDDLSGKAFRYIVVEGGREALYEIDWPRGIDCTNGLKPPGE